MTWPHTAFEDAAFAASSPKLALFYQKEAVETYARANRKEDVTRLVVSMKEAVSHIDGGELFLVKTLRELAEINEDKDLFFGLTERLLQLIPSDNTARFSLAYSYALEGHAALSLYHYLRIPSQERGPEVWNNLGAAFNDLDVHGKSVLAYKKADTLGNTLAMSNLAHKMITAGFIQEAEEVCDRAIKIKDYHKNIGQVITRIKEVAEDEDKKENEIIEKIIPTIEFYKAFGDAATKKVPTPPSGKWKGPDCDLAITFNGNSFEAVGSFERSLSFGALSLLAGPGPGSLQYKYMVRYIGELAGYAITTIHKEERKEGGASATSILTGDPDKGTPALMILSDSLSEIRVYEKKSTKEGKFYKLIRIN